MKNICRVISVLIFVYSIVLTCLTNFNFGTAAMYGVGVLFLLLPLLYQKFRAAFYVISVCLVLTVACCVSLECYGKKDNVTKREDAVIILGAALHGSEPSRALLGRLEAALKYLKENESCVVCVSGGKGYGEDISEAAAMKKWLVEKGVDERRIIIEDKSESTFENFSFSKEKIKDMFGKNDFKAAFVTNDFHVFRAERLAELAGIEKAAHIHSNTDAIILPQCCIRECAAVLQLLILKK